jgi:hypothetical protein
MVGGLGNPRYGRLGSLRYDVGADRSWVKTGKTRPAAPEIHRFWPVQSGPGWAILPYALAFERSCNQRLNAKKTNKPNKTTVNKEI